jgi:hypothetical protein
MSSTINLPKSMNLSEVKPQALNDMKGSMQQYKSQNQQYKQRDTVSIPIPTSTQGAWLHGSDSFISFRFTPEFTDPGVGNLFLDGNILSIFKNVRVRHGSNLLVNHREANRLYQSLFDTQTTSASRVSRSIDMGVYYSESVSTTNNLEGCNLENGKSHDFCVTLPIPLLGSLSEKSLPIGWLTNSQLFLEFDLEDFNRIITSRGDSINTKGSSGILNAPPVLVNYTVSEVYYHAKISKLSPAYDNILKGAVGSTVSFPSQDWIGDSKQIGAGTTSINENFSLPLISSKIFYWWLTNNKTANGNLAFDGFNYNNAISQRMSADLKDYQLSLNGENFPSTAISTDPGASPFYDGVINGSIALQQLYRCWNLNSDPEGMGIFDIGIFGDITTSQVSDVGTKRFIGSVDLDRGSNDNDRQMQGTNTVDTTIGLKASFNSGLTEACNLYAYMLHDCVYNISDGMLSVLR